MNLKTLLHILCFVLVSHGLQALDFQVVSAKGSAILNVDLDALVTHFRSTSKDKKDKSISYAWATIGSSKGFNTVSFDVKGDGSDFYASLFLGQSKYLLDGFETIFPLKQTSWHTVEVPMVDFARNVKPWAVKKMDGTNLSLKSEMIKYIGFGRGYTIYKPNHPNYSFSIRNIKFTNKAYPSKTKLTQGLQKTIAKIKEKKKVKVLLLGDSITDMGRSLSHTVHAFRTLEKKHACSFEIVNAAIGGHSVRGGQIILPRSLAKMAKPDLTVLFFGANDCKSVNGTNGFSEQVFQKQLYNLIDRLNENTKGHTEFLLINGVPRIDKTTMLSTGIVEKISGAYEKLNLAHNLTLCDTMASYNKLSTDKKKVYFKDTIHQTQEGLKFIGSLIEQRISKEIK
ncbi:MAG: GDSL-type esterase/lipase family protein [Lentisphaeraceae bacterium]|nr:GDSL-type esterase/lipase family protein [Lentisphaeraceae bacterium]